MSLNYLDSEITTIAATVHQSAPAIDWREAIATILIPPHGESHGMSFAYVQADGKVNQSWMPQYSFTDLIGKGAMAHWKLSQKLGHPRWYGMIVRVSKAGEFRVQFEYNDNYQIGDLSKPRPAPQPSDLAGLK